MSSLKPFWRYYGGKWRAAPRYPAPVFDTIIEPFAGAAGYSLRYPERQIVLVERYAVVAEIWRYLIAAHPSEILRLPLVEDVRELSNLIPTGARSLIGFHMNAATTTPCVTMSAGIRANRTSGADRNGGWSEATRLRIASQVDHIRHWQIIEGDYTMAPDVPATWFVDPPYDNSAGCRYTHAEIDYAELAAWCRTRRGQILVCENEGATWAPFQTFASFKPGLNGRGSKEVLWELTG